MKNYSPAPWIETEDEDGNVIVVMDKAHSVVVANLEGSCQTCHANARLIKAAPMMLNALEDCLEAFEIASSDSGGVDFYQYATFVREIIKKSTHPE